MTDTESALAKHEGDPMSDYVVRPLTPDTWDAFARMMERHNGVFGGCWCTYFHTFSSEKTYSAEANRALKERLVDEDRAHA
ncbi:MAG TPA: GNAT family N-acetyltransferase, partial [Nocardioidaceae bacterium]|nr:GNAT family N-acetyltransferase [Nocardioidaceae bacterium]